MCHYLKKLFRHYFFGSTRKDYMRRDGACTSLWQDAIADYSTETVIPDRVFDVIIVGGGITGITTGLLLQKSGRSVVIAEAHNLCFGTTGGTTAHLNTFLDNDYNQVKTDFGEDNAQLLYNATRQALDLVKQHIQEYNIDCGYEEKDGFVYSQDEEQTSKLNDILQSSQNAGTEVEWATSIPVPIEFKKAIVYRRQAQFHPTKYVYALAKAFEEAGGTILQQCRVMNVDGSDPFTVETSRGAIKASKLIYATHIPPGVNLLHFRNAPYRSYAMAVKLADDNYPDGLAYDMHDPYHYYRTQDVEGEKYLIVGGEDHKTAHEENTEMCFNHLEAHTRKYFNVAEVAFKWSSQYFEPSDGLAYIGTLPGGGKNMYVATGYGGNGITYSHVAAITLTDMIVKGSSLYEELFNPNRIKMVAGFSNFVKENVDVVKEFVSKRIAKEKITDLSELAKGEAKLVKYEGESIALYKDENGKLFGINPVCPHAKCVVGWNSAEKSWDCPCHGSRFSYDGELLTGPSKRDLEKVDLTDE
jgi:glycine/D-amino acid oxidase-like deaminating enzyme/nitrite reductase/ring-hydroxylating ferredoxin subunit